MAAMMDDDVAALMITNPNTLGLFEEEIEPIADGGARARRARLHGRRQHERAPGRREAGRHGRRRHAVQPAQDVLDAARRRRSGRRPGRGARVPRRRTCRCRVSCGAASGSRWSETLPKSDRPGARRSSATSACWCARYAYIERARRPGARRRRRGSRCSTPTTCARASQDAYELPFDGAVACTSASSPTHARRRTASRRSTSPSASSTTASTRRRSTSRSSCSGAIMIEPTETESKETLDEFVDAMLAHRARRRAAIPQTRPRRRRIARGSARLDETRAARRPVLRWRPPGSASTS